MASIIKNISLDERFVYKGKVYNVVSFLIVNKRYNLANDFYKEPEQGVPALFQRTVLDEMLNVPDVGPIYNDLLQNLISDTVPVHFVYSSESLPKSNIVYKPVKERLRQFEIKDVDFVDRKINQFRQYAYSIIDFRDVDDKCANYSVKFILNTLLRDKINKINKHSKVTLASIKPEYEYLHQQGIGVDVAESLLTDDVTDLHSKKTLMEYRRKTLAEKAEKVRKEVLSDDRKDFHQRDMMNDILRYAREGDWVSVRKLLERHEVSAGIRVALLNIALSQHNFSEAEYLLEAGAMLPPDVLLLPIYANDDAELANALISFGADMNYRDELGWSILMRAIKHDALNVFQILLRNNVNPVQDFPGYDALDVALLTYEKSQKSVYIRGLLNYGYRIDKSHREIVNALSVKNIEIYFKLAEEIPALKLVTH